MVFKILTHVVQYDPGVGGGGGSLPLEVVPDARESTVIYRNYRIWPTVIYFTEACIIYQQLHTGVIHLSVGFILNGKFVG